MSERSGPRPLARRLDTPRWAVGLGLLVLVLAAGAFLWLSGGQSLTRFGAPSSARDLSALFYDSFDGEALDHTRWRVGGQGGVSLAQGDLVLDGSLVARWGDAGLYSVRPLPPRAGRTVVAVARPNVGTIRGPLFLLSPQPFPP
ncbi:MAG: hypothetical protein M3442_06000, partial [Chloroflexota bacterium]|nr:hypothetical protein [Chloroflexota bacterium]